MSIMSMADELELFAARSGVDLHEFSLLPGRLAPRAVVAAAAVCRRVGIAQDHRAAAARRLRGDGHL